MKNLVSAKVVRILKILEKSYFQDRVNIEEIVLFNECSKNTVRADLSYIESHWSDDLDIHVDIQGISISNMALGDYMSIKQALLRDEIALELLMNIFFSPESTIYDHSIELNYSESHLRKTIFRINEFLSVINASVEYYKDGTESRPIIIANDEIKLCHMMANLYISSSFEVKLPLEDDVEPAVFEDFLIGLNLPITMPMQKYIDVLAQVSNSRYVQGFSTREQLLEDYDELYQKYNMRDFIAIFDDSLQNELKTYFGEHYLIQHQSDFKVMNDVLITLLLRIVVSSHNVDDILNRYMLFHKRFKIEHGRAYRIFNEALSKYTVLIGRDFPDYYGEIIYNLYIHLPNIRPHNNYTIGVYSDLATSHAYSLTQYLKRHFQGHYFEVFRDDHKYDFVVSTKSCSSDIGGEDIVLISDLPGAKDLEKIYQEIYSKYKDGIEEEVYL